MDKFKETSLQEERGRGRTPRHFQEEDISHSHQKDTSLRKNDKYSRQEDTLLNRNRSQTPLSHREDTLLNRNRSRTPLSRREDTLLNRNRSRTPLSRQEDTLLNRNRSRTPLSHREDTLLNRNRSRTPLSHQEDTLLNRNRSRTPLSRREDTLLNRNRSRTPLSHISLRSSRNQSLYSYQKDGSTGKNRSPTSYSRREDFPLNINRSRSPYSPYSHREDSLLNIRERETRQRSENREGDREEITELRSALSYLIREVEEIRYDKESLHQIDSHQTRIQYSSSPDPSSARHTKVRNNLEPMNHKYKKAFRDEVVQILKGLDNSLFIDHTRRWLDIEKNVSQNTLPAIKKALGDRFQYTDTELKKVLQNLHRHRRDAYTVSLDPLKSKANKQRTGINSRRKDKKERRQRGLQYMVDNEDQLLIDLQPPMEWDDWINNLNEVIGNSNYHSDEVSESDEEKVQEEKDNKIRPSRKESSNHVLHVYDKQWRSQRARLLLRRADEVGETIQNIKMTRKRWYNDQTYVENNSKPPLNAPKWTISTSYHTE
ncbi:hypothetical protein RhiirA1_478551 [Rhizophagus irregularis]|uniref:Uncharacterized protein n=1 Tax=Rhizophagus irregularis TaxID=588596 RepID=A0A2N0QRW1_9GLOM|nr:hypothetical protein RhiirA1_478551 [Rhizophagus irregularis]